ncbi:MAG TPA: site-2 protease family protein [bacterium]|jgi:membrane-associated protease RseP (regulator of RpoE activity)|nr:site-2 protease family protein [bacterium]
MTWRKILTAVGVIGATVAVHEAAHAVAASHAGGRVKEVGIGFGPVLLQTRLRGLPVAIRAFPLGGYANIDVDEVPPRDRVPLLLAGPLANIALGVALLLALRRHPVVDLGEMDRGMGLTGAIGTFAALFRAVDAGPGAVGRLAGAINVGLGVMNLMPVYPLDGGHIVNSILEARGAPRSARALFTRLTAAVFALIVQRAMVADLRRLARRSPHGR